MRIALIAAIGKHHELGIGDALPWHLPDDVADFHQKIHGHMVLMGRKTFDTVGHPIKSSPTIIITRNRNVTHEGCRIFHSVEEGIAHARQSGEEKLFILGGGEIYTATMDSATDLYLTLVEGVFPDATSFFPPIEWQLWQELPEETSCFEPSERNSHGFAIKHYIRKA
ncbi:MAG: dihydrofolate reductase [Anaerolineae bacterium]|jgi:dihydrofolate reductase|nr:dihydrofolate reductase [Anaerolineae bacterium]